MCNFDMDFVVGFEDIVVVVEVGAVVEAAALVAVVVDNTAELVVAA